jgi:alpha-tubulin suppressor-like RCC1 family protein
LGTGSTAAKVPFPAAVVGAPRFAELAAGEFHTCGLTWEGELYCWGNNDYGQLGDGTRELRATPVRVPAPAIQLAGGG